MLLTRGITQTRGPSWHVRPLPHSWVRTGGGWEGLFSSSPGRAEQAAAGQPWDGRTRASLPAACPTTLRAGPTGPSRALATSLPPTRQPGPLPGLWHAAQLRASAGPGAESPRSVHTRDTRTHAHAHTCTRALSPLLRALKLPLAVGQPAPRPRPASQSPGLSCCASRRSPPQGLCLHVRVSRCPIKV